MPEYEDFVHLGIKRNKSKSISFIVKELHRKLRATFYGLIKDGLHKNGLNPLTSAKIYNSIVLPRELFGSELLQSLSNQDRMSLEKSHRLCLKQMQGLRSRSRTDIVLGLLSILPIEAEIEKRKLSFFGQLCRLERNCAAKQLFLLGLSAFMLDKSIYGFVNDIAIALHKFNFFDVMLKYVEDGSFPSRLLWKNSVTSSISRFYLNELEARTSTHQFVIYRHIQQEYNVNPLWTYAFYYPKLLGTCFSVAQLIVYLSHFETDCSRCGDNHVHVSITEHLLTRCTLMEPHINTFMEKVRMLYGHNIFICLRSMSYEDFVFAIFGINPRFILLLME